MSASNSSYRIVTYQSKLQKRIMISFYAAMMLSVLMAPSLFSLFWFVKLVVIVALGITAFTQYKQVNESYLFNLKEDGKLELEQGQTWQSFAIKHHSLFCDWFCLLKLVSDSPLDVDNQPLKRHMWIWRDGVDDDSFRRICRVIARVRSGA